MGLLGAAQISLGVLFLVFIPFIGTTLISEGVSDIVTAVSGYYYRNFSW